jgi:hypothetical protein
MRRLADSTVANFRTEHRVAQAMAENDCVLFRRTNGIWNSVLKSLCERSSLAGQYYARPLQRTCPATSLISRRG